MTNANLSDAVGLSASPCLQRVKRLEAGGYITGYGAHVNLGKLTESITVFTEVTLIDHRKEDFVRFESNLRNVEELMECHLVSGGYDYLLRFVSRSINHYQERMENLLERIARPVAGRRLPAALFSGRMAARVAPRGAREVADALRTGSVDDIPACKRSLLVTYRRDGTPVPTPVWAAAG